MIKIKYELIRDEKDKLVPYTLKDYPGEFNNLVSIKGPNGSGKSFILNLIGLALFANEQTEDEIDSGLKRKMDNLLDIEKQKLTFELEITSPFDEMKLISRKTNPLTKDIVVSVIKNGKEIPYPKEKFMRDYKLIYVIPKNPATQLPQLLSEIKVSQTEIKSRILQFRSFFLEKIQSLEESRDEGNLEVARKKSLDYFARLRELEEKLYAYENKHTKFVKIDSLMGYLESLNAYNKLSLEKVKLEKKIEPLSKQVVKISRDDRASNKKLESLRNTLNQEKQYILMILSKHTFSDLPHRFEIVRDAPLHTEINKPKAQNLIRENVGVFIERIRSLYNSEKIVHQPELSSLELYSSLLKVLKEPKYRDLSIPGVEGKVNELINQIDIGMKNILSTKEKIDNYQNDISILNEFIDRINEAIILRERFKLDPESGGVTDEQLLLIELRQKKSALDHAVNMARNQKDDSKKRLVKLGIDPDRSENEEAGLITDPEVKGFSKLPHESRKEKINSLNDEINSMSYRKNELAKAYQDAKRIYAELEKKEVNPDRIFLSQLKTISSKLVSLEALFISNLPGSLQKIEKKEIDKFSILDKKYSEKISEYYARKMRTVLYNDEEHTVRTVDIVNERITTISGKEISFDDLGSGHSQSSYLTTKLGMSDTKKMIALFDEIAMMDEKSLSPVVDLVKNYYDRQMLLGAIFVQKAETPIVEEL